MTELDDVNIRHIKLVSGDEILALVNKVDSRRHLIYVERPLVMNSFTLDNKETCYLADWMPFSKTELTAISASHIVAQAEADIPAKDAYIKYCINETNELDDDDLDDEFIEDEEVPDNVTIH